MNQVQNMTQPAQRVWEPYTGDLQSACTPQRLLEIKRRLNEIPHIWNSGYRQHCRPGDCVIGIFSRYHMNRAVIITEHGTTEISLNLDLEKKFELYHLWPGDLVGIKYLGTHKNNLLRKSQDEYALVTDNEYCSQHNGAVPLPPLYGANNQSGSAQSCGE
jgi:hypothetical protein